MICNKVIFVLSNISIGGAQKVAFTILGWLYSRGIEGAIICIGQSSNNYDVPNQIKVISLNQRHSYQAPFTIIKMRTIIQHMKPSVIVTMGVSTSIYSCTALLGQNFPHIISERNDPTQFRGKKIVSRLSRILIKKGDGFVFQTEEVRNLFPDEIKRKSRVIYNPLKSDHLPIVDINTCSETVVTVGRLTAQKNHRLLIDAFSEFLLKHPFFNLKIYGEGELHQDIERYINSIGIANNVMVCGSHIDVHQKISEAMLFILSSDFEGMPNALAEAMAMGLPCISTDCDSGGPRALIKNGINGILIPVGDKEKLVEKMILLASNQNLRRKLSHNAIDIRNKFNMNDICNRWLEYFIEVIANH